MGNKPRAVYWDASAILSVLFEDEHSQKAARMADEKGLHLISTLGYAESCAVLARIKREGAISDILTQAAFDALDAGPWRRLNISPAWEDYRDLCRRWPLRGADLWHLATAKRIQKEMPELSLLTFDQRLKHAAEGEGLAQPAGE
jgi:predicted nucleic acid-binding protein